MKKKFVIAAAATASLLAAALVANAEPSATVTPGAWQWELARSYRSPSGVGLFVRARIRNAATQQHDLLVEVIETTPNAKAQYPHGSTFIVTSWASLGEFRPAWLCFTQPRGYGSADGNHVSIEVDRYTSDQPCPLVPID